VAWGTARGPGNTWAPGCARVPQADQPEVKLLLELATSGGEKHPHYPSQGAAARFEGLRQQAFACAEVRIVQNSNPEILSVRRAARRLGIDPRRLRVAIRTGKLEAYRPGERAVYVRWPDVLRWLRAQRVPSSDHARNRVAEILNDDAQRETIVRTNARKSRS